MVKTLLIFPYTPTPYGRPNYPPLGLAYMAGALARANINYNVLDLRLYDDWQNVMINELKKEYELVGFTCTTFDYQFVRKLAAMVKEHSSSKVMVGGSYPTLVKGRIIDEDKNIDYAISGEGEFALPELCNAIENGNGFDAILGIAYRENGKTKVNAERPFNRNLDELPFPEYSKFDLQKYRGDHRWWATLLGKRWMPMLTSRGCPYTCTYCSIPVTTGKMFRKRSPENVVAEMRMLKEKYRTSMIDFLDDNFTFNVEHAKELCRAIIKADLGIVWHVCQGVRADRVDDELARLMKEANCGGVAVGVESVDNQVLKNLRKAEDVETIERGIRTLKGAGLFVKGFFVVGSPGSSKEEVQKQVDFAKRVGLDEARFSLLLPYPGTELYNWVNAEGKWLIDDPDEAITHYADAGVGYAGTTYEQEGFSAKEMEEAYGSAIQQWEEYDLQRNAKKRLIKMLKRKTPFVYNQLKGVRNFVRATLLR